MAGEAVGDGVGQHRAVAALGEDLALAAHGVGDGERVQSVDALGVHALGVHAEADAGEDVVAHGLAGGLAAHAVEVVEEVPTSRWAGFR